MTHEELVEKASRAYNAAFRDANERSWPLEEMRLSGMRAALAVVYEALREPTPKMEAAAMDYARDAGKWTAMLDASALKPGEK